MTKEEIETLVVSCTQCPFCKKRLHVLHKYGEILSFSDERSESSRRSPEKSYKPAKVYVET